jgi:PAS domain S-box-containing protein
MLSVLRPTARQLVSIALVAVGYFLLALLVLDPRVVGGDLGKIIWPASGFALAALLLFGRRVWLGVAIGAFAATYASSSSWIHSFATAFGNTFEVVAAAHLLQAVARFDRRMERARDVVALLACGFLGAFASASLGVLGLYLSEGAPAGSLDRIWWQWGLGHEMGMVAVTPFLLTAGSWWRVARARASWVEAAGLLGLLVMVGDVAFWRPNDLLRDYSFEYLPFPLLVWAAFRFGLPGAAAANFVTAGMAAWGTSTGWGPFAFGTASEDMVLTWSFVAVSAVTTLLLAAVVTEGRRAEEARLKSEARYHTLIEQADDGVFLAEPDGSVTHVNTRGCELLERDYADVLRMRIPDLAAPDDRDRVHSQIDALPPGRAVMSNWSIARADGSTFPAEVSAKRLDDGRIQAFVRDVTERLALEEQLNQSQKMEAVGLLAGGIAHDFNNLLTAIIGHSDFALLRLADEHKVRSDIEEVAKAASRAADLTRKLLAFARKQIVEPKVIVLHHLVENLETMLERVLGESIELVIRGSGERWKVKVDPVQLEQVILNVAFNARDAMPNGGRLVLETGIVRWSATENHPEMDMLPGNYATFIATDTGVGMDPETLSHVFEPFYTTKDRTQGTGLGLAVSYGIVKQAGGYIWAESELGEGSTFRIFLPIATELEASQPGPRTGRVEREGLAVVGGETILLIEDEPLVRDLTVEVLSSRHYNVLTARDGEEALAIASAHKAPIHLAVTDVVLPAMSGKEVARRLRESRPGLKVLFMSGYAEEQVVHRGVVEKDVAFLAKPFTPAALTQKVRGVLDHP